MNAPSRPVGGIDRLLFTLVYCARRAFDVARLNEIKRAVGAGAKRHKGLISRYRTTSCIDRTLLMSRVQCEKKTSTEWGAWKTSA